MHSLQPPFLPPSVPGSFVALPTALCWDRASRDSQPLWFVGATKRRVQGRMYHFQWKTRLLAMMTLFFGSGFAAPFFIVRHQLLKK